MIDEVTRLMDESGVPLASMDGTDSPEFRSASFSFNGVGEDMYESFVFKNEPTEFTFCKTARKPYDAVVCAVLILVKKWFNGDIEISSDGKWEEWQEGRDMFQRTFGVASMSVFTVKGENKFISAYV